MPKNKKINLTIIFGGKSAEHEVSILSAKSIVEAIDKDKYNISLIGISKKGDWLNIDKEALLSGNLLLEQKAPKDKAHAQKITHQKNSNFLQEIGIGKKEVNVVFPILHGPFGEDGTIQGLLKMLDVPFVGPSILSSAINMDKDISKKLLKEAGIPIVKFATYRKDNKKNISFDNLKKLLGLPFFVKPANLGSSVGISKVNKNKDFEKAIQEAFLYDNKVIIEEGIEGKEIECAVLGNENPTASILGEIIPTQDFYSYDAKYLDENGAEMAIPANISKTTTKKIQELAIKSFKTLCCEGMGRVDFFLTADNKIFVNEINTIPGFTPISMYPKLWEKSGLSYSKLLDKLIQLAISRHQRDKKLKTSV